MLRATAVIRRPAVERERICDTLELDHDGRHRRRLTMRADGGLAFLLDLDAATVLEDGDALQLEDGRLVLVHAAPEQLLEIRADSALGLKKIIWHLGNRHVLTEIADEAVYIAEDHVLLEMVRGQGGSTRLIRRPFRPERGAYEAGHGHGSHSAHGHHVHGADGHVHDHDPGPHHHGHGR